MPFCNLVAIAKEAVHQIIYGKLLSFEYALFEKYVSEECFFWIDVFSKNQHIPAPAMEEFHQAISIPRNVVFSMWPSTEPIPLSRVWCLFEIFTALKLTESVNSHFIFRVGEAPPDNFEVDVRNASATVAADVEMILGMIEKEVGLDICNQNIKQGIKDLLEKRARVQAVVQHMAEAAQAMSTCFDGNGQVAVPTSKSEQSYKLVKYLCPGDKVYTHEYQIATIDLITKSSLSTSRPNLEPQEVMALYPIEGVYVTPQHRIYCSKRNRWVKAREMTEPTVNHQVDMIYNFELVEEYGSSILINGVPAMTLGQTIGFDPQSDAKYGYGWKNNPIRKKWLLKQQQELEQQQQEGGTHG